MEKLKRYDVYIDQKDEETFVLEQAESPTGRYMLADDVKLREEVRKLTIEQLRAQFENSFYNLNYLKDETTKYYSDEWTHQAFYMYRSCAQNNGILKDGE